MELVFRKSILLEDGTTRNPLVSFPTKGTTGHIVVEDNCYVVFLDNPAGKSARSPWLSSEACSVLSKLPPPQEIKKTESQLTLAVRRLMLSSGEKAREFADEVYRVMPHYLREELSNIVVNGPVWDGDVVSKKGRDELLSLGLIFKTVGKDGSEGYQAANWAGNFVHFAPNRALPAVA